MRRDVEEKGKLMTLCVRWRDLNEEGKHDVFYF